jgi:predicted enzyme related to lactoylglutathione lyase
VRSLARDHGKDHGPSDTSGRWASCRCISSGPGCQSERWRHSNHSKHRGRSAVCAANVRAMQRSSFSFIEFPADDPERARRFWQELLGVELEARKDSEVEGWQTHSGAPAVGVHARGRGPGDSVSLPYFAVTDVAEALERVEALGGSVVHPGQRWAICRDSEGSPFGLAADSLT